MFRAGSIACDEILVLGRSGAVVFFIFRVLVFILWLLNLSKDELVFVLTV